jgi:hypothetical protein
MKVIVYHAGYGCDTGCCGHVVELEDGQEKFEFAHPWLTGPKADDPRAWAEELVRDTFGEEHVADLDWENCRVVDD